MFDVSLSFTILVLWLWGYQNIFSIHCRSKMAQGTAGFTSLALDEAKWPTTPAKETRSTSERREKTKCFIVFSPSFTIIPCLSYEVWKTKGMKPPTKNVPVFLPWIVHNTSQHRNWSRRRPGRRSLVPPCVSARLKTYMISRRKTPAHITSFNVYDILTAEKLWDSRGLRIFHAGDAIMMMMMVMMMMTMMMMVMMMMNVNRRCLSSCTWDYGEEERCFQLLRSWWTDLKWLEGCSLWALTVCCTISRCIRWLLIQDRKQKLWFFARYGILWLR